MSREMGLHTILTQTLGFMPNAGKVCYGHIEDRHLTQPGGIGGDAEKDW